MLASSLLAPYRALEEVSTLAAVIERPRPLLESSSSEFSPSAMTQLEPRVESTSMSNRPFIDAVQWSDVIVPEVGQLQNDNLSPVS